MTLASSSLVAGMRQPLPTKPSAINQGNEGLVWLPFFDRSRTASLEAGVARAKRAGGGRGQRLLGRRVWAPPQQRLGPRRGLQHLEGAHQILVDVHHRAAVVKLSAVVGRGEDRHELPLREELVAVLDDLSESTLCQP